jgi:hypothetical protein
MTSSDADVRATHAADGRNHRRIRVDDLHFASLVLEDGLQRSHGIPPAESTQQLATRLLRVTLSAGTRDASVLRRAPGSR